MNLAGRMLTGAFLLALILVAPASAATQLDAALTTSSAQSLGPNSVHGLLVAFSRGTLRDNAGSPPFFELSAAALRVETYDQELHARPIDVLGSMTQIGNQDYENAVVRGTQNRDGYQLNAFPLQGGSATVDIESSCSDVRAAQDPTLERYTQVYSTTATDAHMVADTRHAVSWSSCSDQLASQSNSNNFLTIRGAFVVMLWQWDAHVESSGETTELPSGHEQSSYDPVGSPTTTSLVSHDRQRYLYTDNGTLTMPLGNDTPLSLFLAGATLHATSQIALQHAQGTLVAGSDSIAVDAATLDVRGVTDLALSSPGIQRPMDAALTGSPTTLTMDGVSLPLSSTIVSPSSGWGFALAIGVVLVPLTAIPVLRRRKPSAARMRRVEDTFDDLLNRMRFAEALPLGRKLLDWQPHNPRSHYRLGRILRHMGAPELAVQHHEEAQRLLENRAGQRILRGENSFEMASALAILHARADSSKRLDLCLRVLACMNEAVQDNANLQGEMELHPELRQFLVYATPGVTVSLP